MDYSLWTEASIDIEAQRAAERLTRAKVAVAPLWPFLAMAKSGPEFEHRLALVAERIAEHAEGDLWAPVVASLREDFRRVTAKDDDDKKDDDKGTKDDDDSDSDDDDSDDDDSDDDSDKDSDDDDSDDSDDSDDDDKDDNKPPWLKGTKGAYFHATRKVWVDVAPAPIRPVASYFHAGLGRWVAADDDATEGGGNPYYFTGGPEGGPNTGQTNQFPSFPGAPDPVDPLNQMFPMQPEPWTGGVEWQENPMQFSPPNGQTAVHGSRGRHPFADRTAAAVGATDSCADCGLPVRYVSSQSSTSPWWSHTGEHGALADDDHQPSPAGGQERVRRDWTRSESPHHRYTHAAVEQNPHYFDGGPDTVQGDEAFPPDVAKGVDPDDRINEDNWLQPLAAASAPHHNPPDSDPLLGTEFDSEQERERWNKAQSGERPGSRDSTALTGARHTFYDPSDRGVVVTALGTDDPTQQQAQPATGGQQAGPVGDAPQPPPSMTGGPGSVAQNPLTTPPRQIPGGGAPQPGADPERDATSSSMSATSAWHLGLGSVDDDADSRQLPTADNPSGLGDEYREKTINGPLNSRPRQSAEHRNVNTPQRPFAPVPTRSSSDLAQQRDDEDEDDRREASRIAQRAIRELVGV